MRNQQVIKLFLILILCTAFIFSFSHFGAQAYDSIMNDNDGFMEGTMIGSVSVAGGSTNDALQQVDEQLTKWLNETTFTFHYKEKSVPLDLSYFTFDVEKTVQQAKQGQKNTILVSLEPIDDFLSSISSTLRANELQWDVLEEEILVNARLLEVGNYSIRLENFFVDVDRNEPVVIHEAIIKAETPNANINRFIDVSMEIEPISQFSLLEYLKDHQLSDLPTIFLSQVATAIYEVILPTNFTIIERHTSNELPSYATLGFEASVDESLNQDLVISNPNEFSFFIEFQGIGNDLSVSLKGPEFLNQYVISSKEKESFKPKTVVQFNPQLGPIDKRVINEGKEGQLIKVFRKHLDEKGTLLKEEQISDDFYPPIHRVEVTGLIIDEGNATINPNDYNENEDSFDEIEEDNPPESEEDISEEQSPNSDSEDSNL